MSQVIERIARLETLLEDNNKAIHHIEEALFGNGKPGLISDFRPNAPVSEPADDLDLKSKGRKAWGFESPSGHHLGENS